MRHHQTNKDERATDHHYSWALIRAKQLSVALPSLFVWWLGRRLLCVPLAMDQLYWPGQVGVIPSDYCHLSLITDFRRYSYSNEIKIHNRHCWVHLQYVRTYAYQHIKTTGCIAVHTACSSLQCVLNTKCSSPPKIYLQLNILKLDQTSQHDGSYKVITVRMWRKCLKYVSCVTYCTLNTVVIHCFRW